MYVHKQPFKTLACLAYFAYYAGEHEVFYTEFNYKLKGRIILAYCHGLNQMSKLCTLSAGKLNSLDNQ